jgi:hypothetical protein
MGIGKSRALGKPYQGCRATSQEEILQLAENGEALFFDDRIGFPGSRFVFCFSQWVDQLAGTPFLFICSHIIDFLPGQNL